MPQPGRGNVDRTAGAKNAAGLDKARRSLHGCFAADLYGEGDTNLAAAVVQALEHRRRLLVCADAAAGA